MKQHYVLQVSANRLREAAMNSEQLVHGTALDGAKQPLSGSWLLAAGGVLGALAASSCCVAPLVLISLGVGGAWMGNLNILAPYSTYILAFALVCLGGGFYVVYRKPRVECADGMTCAQPVSNRVVKVSLWGGAILIKITLLVQYVVPFALTIS